MMCLRTLCRKVCAMSNEYFINQEWIEEMVRLNRQATLVTREMGGTLPEQQDTTPFQNVLDLACGPGEWVMQVARSNPHTQRIIGVDKSKRMIEYAIACAAAESLPGIEFQILDVTQPLTLPEASFDLINGRFLLSFMQREQWPLLLTECYRLLRPGGVLRITEQESGFANDPVYQKYMDLWGTAWRKAGHGFAHTQSHIGVTVVLKLLMRQAGFVDPQHRPISIDISTGAAAHQEMLENFTQALNLARPFLLRLGVISQRGLNAFHKQMEALMSKDGFCAYWLLQTIWAIKPDGRSR
jgi:SAM-dependent methyltransferase